jgi:pimeloyl-ACP methyl ester carboxylesterase
MVAIAIVAISVWSSLDWDRTHTRANDNLPFFQAGMPDGLYRLRANGLIFRARIYGAANDGPGIVMLHGHPETSMMWGGPASAAARRGFRVVAFDQRGYSPGARPLGVAAYRADNQVADVVAIANALGFDSFHLVGHDWGAVIAWTTTIFHPERVSSLTAMSIPHPQTLRQMVVEKTPAYVRLFEVPWLAETTLLFNDLSGYRDVYSEQSEAEIAEYLGVLSEPGASTATLNWYRTIQDSLMLLDSRDPKICSPTLFVYGDKEFWVSPDYLEKQQELVRGRYTELELDAGHWLVQRHPDEVTAAAIEHITQSLTDPDQIALASCQQAHSVKPV